MFTRERLRDHNTYIYSGFGNSRLSFPAPPPVNEKIHKSSNSLELVIHASIHAILVTYIMVYRYISPYMKKRALQCLAKAGVEKRLLTP